MEIFKTKKLAQKHLMELCQSKKMAFNGFIYPNAFAETVPVPEGAVGITGLEMLELSKNEAGNTVSRKYTEYAAFAELKQ